VFYGIFIAKKVGAGDEGSGDTRTVRGFLNIAMKFAGFFD
jgi:hypothetical protein